MKRVATLLLILALLSSCKSSGNNTAGTDKVNRASGTPQASATPAPTASPLQATPAPTPFQGSLTEIIPQRVGDYRRSETDRADDIKAKLNARDALVGIYQRLDGAEELQHLIVSFDSTESAQRGLRRYVEEALKEAGSKLSEEGDKTNREGARVGQRIFISLEQAEKVMLLWTNGSLLYGVLSGKRADAAEFERNYP